MTSTPAEIESRLIATEHRAHRAETAATAATNGLATVEQYIGALTREVSAARGEIRVLGASIRTQIADLHERLPKQPTSTLEDLEYEETSPGGRVTLSRETWKRFRDEENVTQDARRWRQLWRRVRWAVWVLVGGGLGLGGEQIVTHLLHLHL